jgi:hypothetical protein
MHECGASKGQHFVNIRTRAHSVAQMATQFELINWVETQRRP